MEAISGRKTIQQIAADHAIHRIQVSQWKQQLLDGASELLTRGKQTRDKGEGQQGLLEVCLNSPGLVVAPTVSCARTAPDPWPPSPPTRLLLQAI